MTMGLASWNEYLYAELQDKQGAAAYLDESFMMGMPDFLHGLRKYIQATGGFTKCAKETGLSRESLYKMLSEDGNPELRSIMAILKSRGLRLAVLGEDERSQQLDFSRDSDIEATEGDHNTHTQQVEREVTAA